MCSPLLQTRPLPRRGARTNPLPRKPGFVHPDMVLQASAPEEAAGSVEVVRAAVVFVEDRVDGHIGAVGEVSRRDNSAGFEEAVDFAEAFYGVVEVQEDLVGVRNVEGGGLEGAEVQGVSRVELDVIDTCCFGGFFGFGD